MDNALDIFFWKLQISSSFQQNSVPNAQWQFHDQLFTNCKKKILEFNWIPQETTEVAECFSSSVQMDLEGYIHSLNGNQYVVARVSI